MKRERRSSTSKCLAGDWTGKELILPHGHFSILLPLEAYGRVTFTMRSEVSKARRRHYSTRRISKWKCSIIYPRLPVSSQKRHSRDRLSLVTRIVIRIQFDNKTYHAKTLFTYPVFPKISGPTFFKVRAEHICVFADAISILFIESGH